MSSMGVPSSMSSLLTLMFEPLIPSTSTTDIPIGLGLMGEQMLNTPISLPSRPDVCRRNSREKTGLRWKLKITTMRWPGSMSRSPSEYCSSMSSVPSTSETLQCRGSSSASVRTKPMVLNSMLIAKPLVFAPTLDRYHFKIEHTAIVLESNGRRSSGATGRTPPSTWPCSAVAARDPLTRALRPANDGGRSRLGQGEEREKALYHRPLSLDLYLPCSQRLSEGSTFVNQRPQRGGLALDGSVGPLRIPPGNLKAPVCNLSPEDLLPKPQLVERLNPFCSARIEHRPKGEDERINPQRGIARPHRRAGTPVPQRDDHWLKLLAPLTELIHPGGSRRRQLPPAYHPRSLKLPQALGQDVGARIGQARPEVGEALGAKQQLADDQQRPPLAYEVEGVGSCAAVVVGAPLRCGPLRCGPLRCGRGRHAWDSTTASPDARSLRCFFKSTGCVLGLLPYAAT